MTHLIAGALVTVKKPSSTRVRLVLLVAVVSIIFSVGCGNKKNGVPDVVDEDVKTATEVLEKEGLKVEVTKKADPEAEAGTVLEQTPEAGEDLPEDKIVRLVVAGRSDEPADGKPTEGEPTEEVSVEVPNLVGRKQTEAEAMLEPAGLVRGEVERVPDNQHERDTVLSHNPGAGKKVAAGTAVDLRVAEQDQFVEVPGVVGQAEEAARATLTGKQLRVGTTRTTLEGAGSPNTVVEQNPNAGIKVIRDTEVVLTVKQDAVVVPEFRKQNINTIGAQMANSGLMFVAQGRFFKTVRPGTILDQAPAPGTRVARNSTVRLIVARSSFGPVREDVIRDILKDPRVRSRVKIIP